MQKDYEEFGEGRYCIMLKDWKRPLGKGAFADVYLCHKLIEKQPSPQTFVVKRIIPRSTGELTEEMLEAERTMLFSFAGENKHVVQVYDFYCDPATGKTDIVMEYCEGGDLETYVNSKGVLSEKEISTLLRPVVEGFILVHASNIIHRDLKLANLLLVHKLDLAKPPEVRISDFGLATVGNIHAIENSGTLPFMAPELFADSESLRTDRIDVWSFGVILYRMLFGFLPFTGNGIMRQICENELRLPKIRLPSRVCIDLILKCLRRNPLKRIAFRDIAQHPFFTEPNDRPPFHELFDGYFGYVSISLNNEYELLNPEPGGLVPVVEPDPIDLHNEEILKKWQSPPGS